ncbi:N-acetylmuramoyl-L-alanine amidase [Parachlamydia sp. AcF125]|uniref:N-acetylmuramoyl-L-alanine amidase family protein n=1 Tax=Parachlamydia sp. AcF125 TaxID=2795736 RepID=UPI001BCA1EBA|nr:N-acetylmuramoyl-L-alanine amidase [Parachlamydia sp. AcF125]
MNSIFSKTHFVIFSLLISLQLVSCSHRPSSHLDEYRIGMQEPTLIAYSPVSKRHHAKKLIVIDAGHGGDDAGAEATNYTEKHLNLATARLLRVYLKQLGYSTAMTRDADFFVSLDKRASFANSKNPVLFVSLHYNSAPNKKAEGIEVYYYHSEKDKKRTTQSKILANSVLEKVIQATSAKSRGIRAGNFAVIRETHMPAILVEGGFLTNEKEVKNIKDPVYLKKLAWGVAQGIAQYLSTHAG